MTGKRNFNAAMRKRSSRQPTKNKRFSGYLGIRTGGANTVEVAGRPGFVWVRLRNVTNEVIQAFNETTSPVYNLPVLVERDLDSPTRYRIVSRDIDVYGSNWGTSAPYLANHGFQHSWNNNDPNIGGDVTWVYQQQFTPLMVMPSGSNGAGNVLIGAGINHYGNIFSYVGSTGTGNLLTYKPTGSTANLLLVYLDHETGNFGVLEGTPVANTVTGTYQVVANLPAPPTGTVPLAGIRLVSGTSSIGWRNIYDVRPFFVAQTTVVGGGGGGAPTDASYVTLGLDGDLSAERVLTAGTDVTITDAGANDNVTVAVASGTFSRPGHVHNWALPVYEDTAFKVTGTSLVFTDNMFVGVTGTIAYIGMTGSVGGAASADNTLLIYDNSVFKVTGTSISFDENLTVAITGSVAYVSMTGSVGGVAGVNELPAYDNNVFQATGTAFIFNDNLDVAVTGTFVYINGTGATGTAGPPGASGDNTTLIYDDSVFKVTGTSISFDTNLSVGVTGSTAYVSSSGGGGGLTLADLRYKIHVSADTGITTGTSGVSQWDNQTIWDDYYFLQETATNQPLWILNVINGEPVVRFDGVDNYLYMPYNAGGVNRFTMVVVIRPLDASATKGIVSWGGSPTDSTPFLIIQRNSTDIRLYMNTNYRFTIAHATNATKVYSIRWDGITWRVRVDTVDETDYTGGGGVNQSTSGILYLGSGYNGYSNVEIPEFYLYEYSMSDSEVNTIETALMTKYGL